jgi:hypothetical protein
MELTAKRDTRRAVKELAAHMDLAKQPATHGRRWQLGDFTWDLVPECWKNTGRWWWSRRLRLPGGRWGYSRRDRSPLDRLLSICTKCHHQDGPGLPRAEIRCRC